MIKYLSVTSVFTFLYFNAFPQAQSDTAFVSISKMNTIARHRDALGAQAGIYNGSLYVPPKQTFDQHPYFLSEDWITGTLWYDGEYFSEVPIMYDLSNDAVIAEHYPSGHAIQLVRAKLDRFSVAGHFFEMIENESASSSLPKTGFYEVLYKGETKVIAARKKFLREKIEVKEITITYEDQNRYFILLNGVFFPVRSKASVLKLMDDRRQELKKFLRQQKLVFGGNRELMIKGLAAQYDKLK